MGCSSRLTATALAALLAGPLLAQAPVPIAFVDVRVVDGSGNEPFTGTVVVENGRIQAAGRSIEPPPAAAVVDGSGKTLVPGLVDVRALDEVPPSAEEWTRLLARLLAAGVTTAVVPRGPADAMADPRLSPRLILAGDQIAAVSADAADAEASVAEAGGRGRRTRVLLPRGADLTRVLAWQPSLIVGPLEPSTAGAFTPGATVTVAPEATPAPPSADVLKALEAARVRLAWGSSGTAARLEAPHATLSALADAGVPPLALVTAATSGSAWGLGLQSDRGFIVAGMRADLLLVGGDPTSTIADLGRIDQIYLGGVPVDRDALARAAAEPVAPAPPTPAATTDEEPGAAPPAATAPARPESARARRQRLARERAAAAAAAKASATPPAVTPEAPDTPAAPAEPVPAPPAPSAPSTTSSAVPTADPDEAAPAPTPVEPAAPAASPVGNPLLDDFERGDNRSAVGPAWVATTEQGVSPTTIVMGRVVKGLRDHALLLSARMGSSREPFARAALPLSADGGPVDVSRFRGLRFDARGEGRYRIVFVTRGVADGRYHESYFSGSPLWTPVSVPFASTGQNGAGPRVRWTGRDLVEIRFELARDAGRLGWLELDNVRLY